MCRPSLAYEAVARASPVAVKSGRFAELRLRSPACTPFLGELSPVRLFSKSIGRLNMHNRSRLLALAGTTLAVFALAAPAHAQATRTWVSGTGSDANPCSR